MIESMDIQLNRLTGFLMISMRLVVESTWPFGAHLCKSYNIYVSTLAAALMGAVIQRKRNTML